jgi:hypothetical protein
VARCGQEGLHTLLSSGHGAEVHSHVPLPRVAICQPWCVGLAIGTSGDGGLARRATLTFTDVVVLVVVAVVIIVIAVFCCCTCSGCHRCRCFRHWAGETVWKTVAWLLGTQRWCRASSGQPEARYCPCESLPVADRPKL